MKNSEEVYLVRFGKVWFADGKIEQRYKFKNIETLLETMNRCLPDGEWVEDLNGNKIDIKIEYATNR